MMKHLLESWREYNRLNERINTLDPDSGKRFINDLLIEVVTEDNSIQIPEGELDAIKQWAGLSGAPSFLGSGSRGRAYKFGNRVLKFTNDLNEARAAALIAGKTHPNVYDIYTVGKRLRENMDNSSPKFKHAAYVIVYGFLNYPTTAMIDVGQQLYYKIRDRNKNLFYHWKDSNLEEAKTLISEFVASVKQNPELLGEPSGGRSSRENLAPKIKNITSSLGWSEEQHNLFITIWTLIGGLYGTFLETPAAVEEYTSKIINDPRLDHFHQLALGITFLKENDIIFDDLKTSNIMEKAGQAAIIDIGYSMVKGDPELPEIDQ